MVPGRRAMRFLVLVVAMFAFGGWAGTAMGQSSGVTVLAGASSYDLSGVGNAWFSGARFDARPIRFLVLEAGLHYFHYTAQSDDRVRHLIPEAQLQFEPVRGPFRPYLGAGAGAAWLIWRGDNSIELSLSAALGFRVDLRGSWGLLAEGRVRSIDPWVGSLGELGLGISRRF